MKGLGIGLVRWLVGLLFGLVAAALLLEVAALLAGSGPAAGALGLLAMGFGLAFFPSAFATGTRSPMHVLRRAAVAITLEGLVVLALAGYPLATGSRVAAPGSFDWARTVQGLTEGLATQVSLTVAAVAGVIVFLLGLVILLGLRPPAGPAPVKAPAAAPAPSATQKLPAAQPAPAGKPVPEKALPDEDAQLMADLENLRKKLPQ